MLLGRSTRSRSLSLSTKLHLSPPPHLSCHHPTLAHLPALQLLPSHSHFRTFHLSHSHLTIPLTPLSTVSGPVHPPLLHSTLGTFWDSLLTTYPRSPALICRHESSTHYQPDSPSGHRVGEGEGDCLRWDYQQMGKRVDALARGLRARGVNKGDRVAVVLGNGSAYALLQWATAKIGAILVCINPSSSSSELLSALTLTSSSTLLLSPTLRSRPFLPILHSLFPTLASTPPDQDLQEKNCPGLKRVVLVDNTSLGARGFGDMLQDEGVGGRDFRGMFEWSGEGEGVVEIEGERLEPDDVVNFQFTSGTTGLPKAVALTHSNVLNNGLYIGQCMALRRPSPEEGWQGEKLVNSPPAFHCFGLVLGNLALWTHGGCVIYASESFSPSLALRAAHLERATALHGVPTMFIAELALLRRLEQGERVEGLSDLLEEGKGGKLDFQELRTGIAAGSPVPDEVMRAMVERMNLRDLTITYGMSETSPATCMSTTSDPLPLRCDTVGRVLPHTHLRIVSPSHPLYPSPQTPSVPIGEPGELWSGGFAMMKGYWSNEDATREVMFDAALPAEEVAARRAVASEEGEVQVTLEDGQKHVLAPKELDESIRWIRTGDQATMDEKGYVRIVGRIKDIIIRGGENLFPVVIEARMLKLEGVEDCSIISVPHPLMGEVVGAFIQRSPSSAGRSLTSATVRQHITDLLGHQSAPDWVWYLGEEGVEASYPVTQSGKIRKVELREWGKKLAEQEIGRARME